MICHRARSVALHHGKGTSEVRDLEVSRAAGPLVHSPRKREREGKLCSGAETCLWGEREEGFYFSET